MTTIHETSIPWNSGEEHLHNLLKVPYQDNPTSPFLTPSAAALLQRAPLLALGTFDDQHRPWTTLLGGEAGFTGPIGESVIGIKTNVDLSNDPVLQALMNGKVDGEVVKHEGKGKLLSGLAIHLNDRRRVKIAGRMLAGALSKTEAGIGEAQLAVRIEESLGNCPKYLNRKQIVPRLSQSQLISDSVPLPEAALDLVTKTDLFFISSSDREMSMDTNYRGGPPGFVRVISNTNDDCILIYPEYSGNRLYQTLGNLQVSPLAGVVIPDLSTGNVLYLTVRAEVLTGQDAKAYLPRSNLAVKFYVVEARFVEKGLAFTAEPGEYSPYNPPVQHLPSESKHALGSNDLQLKAKLLKREILAPTIARFTFELSEDTTWTPGQYVALDFFDEMDIGYSHMRDDDPVSLNDDLVRTFTISNPPIPGEKRRLDITVRKVGRVTGHLFRWNERAGPFEVSIRGIEGDFMIKMENGKKLGFVAGGVGITPLLSHKGHISYNDLILFWNIKVVDLGMVVDTFEKMPGLAKSTRLFVTGDATGNQEILEKLKNECLVVNQRRMVPADVGIDSTGSLARWYVCTSPAFRQSLIEWLPKQEIVYEDFNY